MRALPILAGLALCLIVVIPASACLWDTDTLAMENERFPEVLELITGKFLRHSSEFYTWRIQDRTKKLSAEPEQLAYYDDLSVAYEKTGDHRLAIETMLLKDKKKPHSYETLANLGTFYIHNGEFEKGLTYIDQAIAINPDAHFGREVYQKYLVQYLLSKMDHGKYTLPLQPNRDNYKLEGFAKYLAEQRGFKMYDARWEKELAAALKGVLGMMKFGTHDSPVLLEALGDLLLTGTNADAKQLAARAYLKASYETKGTVSENYRNNAKSALSMQHNVNLTDVEGEFAGELSSGKAWYEKVRADELAWISAGENPELKFAAKYYAEPRVIAPVTKETSTVQQKSDAVGPAPASEPQKVQTVETQSKSSNSTPIAIFAVFMACALISLVSFLVWSGGKSSTRATQRKRSKSTKTA